MELDGVLLVVSVLEGVSEAVCVEVEDAVPVAVAADTAERVAVSEYPAGGGAGRGAAMGSKM